jgi:hypothetical protein
MMKKMRDACALPLPPCGGGWIARRESERDPGEGFALQKSHCARKTPLPCASGRALDREQYPEDLIGTMMFLSSPASDFITGQTINVDGGKAMHRCGLGVPGFALASKPLSASS